MEDANDAPGCAACEASPLTLPTELLSTTVDRLAAIEVTKPHMAPRANLTGFDPRKLAAASGLPRNDPWARAEAWRYTGPFSRWNRFKGAFPGFGIAAGAFAVYLVYEAVFVKDKHGHGEIGQGKDHHTLVT